MYVLPGVPASRLNLSPCVGFVDTLADGQTDGNKKTRDDPGKKEPETHLHKRVIR
jgi:hypothetical protein